MTKNMTSKVKETRVKYEFHIGSSPHELYLKLPMMVPASQNAMDMAHRIIKLHNIPVYYHAELVSKLRKVIKQKNWEYYNEKDKKCLDTLKTGSLELKSVVSYWKNKLCENKQEDEKIKVKDDFAYIYHSLVHSPSVYPLLALEQSYADAVSSLVAQKEISLKELHERQGARMQEMVKGVGSHVTDDDVNNLAAEHLEESQLMEVKWDSTVSALKEEQKRELKKFVMESFEGREITTPITPKDFIGTTSTGSASNICEYVEEPNKEESFTIHLGTQMKQMHNLRLLATNVLQLLKYQKPLEESEIPPQRIQTSMSLFSHNLNGLVLLVNDRINTYTGLKKDFGRVCSRSTELHFPELEDQLESIRNVVPEVMEWRRGHPPPNFECEEENQPPQVHQNLKSGDFYITRHSNLPDVHVVFHVVVDEGLSSSDINSRHSVILGLRNVLKVACLADITTLTVPLLLTHTLTEEMTVSWCQKRAELVYKCIKGFMIEMSSWGGTEMKNLQFLVPKGISDDLFNNLASMLQSIFRLSNPLVVKTLKS